jgi:hypothetical protein
VAACLARNINSISSACRTVMLRYQQQDTSVATPVVAKATSLKTRAASRSKGPVNIKPKLSASRAGSRS